MGPGKKYQKADGTGSVKTYEEMVKGGFDPDALVKQGLLKEVADEPLVTETPVIKKKSTDASESSQQNTVSSTNPQLVTSPSASDTQKQTEPVPTPPKQPVDVSGGTEDKPKPVTADDINNIQNSLFNNNNIRSQGIVKDAFTKTVPDIAKDLHAETIVNEIKQEPQRKEEFKKKKLAELQNIHVKDNSIKIDPYQAIKADITAPGNMSAALVAVDEKGAPVLDPVEWITESPERLKKYYDLRKSDINNGMQSAADELGMERNIRENSEKRIKLMQQENILDAAVKHYGDELAFKLSKGDTKAAGRISTSIFDPKKMDKITRYEAQGLPVRDADLFQVDMAGVNIYRDKLNADRNKKISDLDNHIETLANEYDQLQKENAQYVKDGNYVNAPQAVLDKAHDLLKQRQAAEKQEDAVKDDPEYWTQLYELDKKRNHVLNDHPEFKKQQIGRVIGNVIAKHLNEVQKTTGAYNLTDEMIQKAGKEAGIPKEDMKGISSDDIPNATVLNQAFGGLYEEGINLGAGVARFLGGTVLGLNKDYIDAYTAQAQERAHDRFKPADSELMEGAPTIVNTNPISDNYLHDERNPDRGKSNYKFSNITQNITKKFVELAAMVVASKGLGGYAEIAAPGITKAAEINAATSTAEEIAAATKAQATIHNAGLATYMIGSNYERHYQDATRFISEKPEDEGKRGLYSILMGSIDFAAMTLPLGKYGKAVSTPAREEATMEIGRTIKNTPNFPELDAVHREVLTHNVEKYLTTVIGNTGKETIKFGGGLTAGILAGKLVNHAFGDNKEEVHKADLATGDEMESMLQGLPLMMIPVGFGEAMRYKQNSQVYKEMLTDLGMHPNTYLSNIADRVETGFLTKDQGRQKAEVVAVMKKIVDGIPDTSPVSGKKLSHEERVEYAYKLFKESGLKIQGEKVKDNDPLLYDHYKKQIEAIQLERDQILAQPEVVSSTPKAEPTTEEKPEEKVNTDQQPPKEEPVIKKNNSAYEDIKDDQTVKEFTDSFNKVNETLDKKQRSSELTKYENHIGEVLQAKAESNDAVIPDDKLPEAQTKFIDKVFSSTDNSDTTVGEITNDIVKEFSSPKTNQNGTDQNVQGDRQRRPEEEGNIGQATSEGSTSPGKEQGQAIGQDGMLKKDITGTGESAGTSFPTEEEFKNKGEIVKSMLDAETRLSNGERIFAAHDMDGEPTKEIINTADLKPYTADQLIALPAEEGPGIEGVDPTISKGDRVSFAERYGDKRTGIGVVNKILPNGNYVLDHKGEEIVITPDIDTLSKVPFNTNKKPSNETEPRDTETLSSEATDTASKIESTTGEQRSAAIQKADDLIDEIDSKLKLLGHYDSSGDTEKDMHENGSRTPEKKFKQDLVKYSKELAKLLGYEHETLQKGKTSKIEYANTNVAPVGGDGHIILWKPNSEYGVYISVPVERNDEYDSIGDHGNEALDIMHTLQNAGYGPIMWRVTTKKNKYSGLANQWIKKDITAGEFAKLIRDKVNDAEKRNVVGMQDLLTGKEKIGTTKNDIPDDKTNTQERNNTGSEQDNNGESGSASGSEKTGEKKQEKNKEEDPELRAAKDKFKESLRKARGTLNSGINPDVIAAGVELLAAYAKHGIKKFADVMRNLIDDFGKEFFDKENTEAVKGVYAYERSRLTKEQRQEYDNEDAVDLFIENELPKLLKDGTESNGPVGRVSEGISEGAGSGDVLRPEISRETGAIPPGEGNGSDRRTEPTAKIGDGLSASEGDSMGNTYATTGGSRENVKENELLGGTSKKDIAPKKPGEGVIAPARNGRNLVIPPDFEPMPTFNINQKYDDNISAIKTLIDLLPDHAHIDSRAIPTKEQQAALFKYVGFGGLKEILFDPNRPNDWNATNSKYKDKVKQIYDLAEQLKQKGFTDPIESIKKSVQNAHFTSIPVIRGMYSAIEALGFDGGKVLEPSAGIGHFFGAMPWTIAKNSDLSGVEIDEITGNILKSLYPDARIAVTGLEEAQVPNNYFDLTVSNVPFGNVKIFDPEMNKSKKPALVKSQTMVHTYFFAKGLEVTRPGGLVAFITSNGILDSKGNDFLRKHIAETAEFLGAIRLPNTAFKANANTEVVTDMIFLRKFNKGEKGTQKYDFLNILPADVKHKNDGGRETVQYNQFFHDHPEYMFGKPMAGGLYNRDEFTLIGDKNADIEKQIKGAAAELFPKPLYSRAVNVATDPDSVQKFIVESASNLKTGNLVITKENKVGQLIKSRLDDGAEQSAAYPITTKFPVKQIKEFIKLRDGLNKLFAQEIGDEPDAIVLRSRNNLNNVYDDYVKNYGQLNAVKNKQLLSLDIDGYNVGALERLNKETGKMEKADIFSKRTLRPFTKVTSAETAEDAIIASLNEMGHLNQDRISSLLGQPFDKIYEENKGKIYEAPDGGWVTREEYLSGNVKKKLLEAEQAAAIDPRFQFNVDALKEVIPEDIRVADIEAKIGVRWIDPHYYDDFAKELFNTKSAQVKFLPGTDTYKVEQNGDSPEERITYGTERMRGSKILNEALHGRTPQIFDTIQLPGGKEQRVLNPAETAKAIEKFNLIKERFADWIWRDEERRDILGRKYNDLFNNTVKRNYDGSFLTLPGLNSLITPHPHQKDTVWMLAQNNGGIVDHIVGSGKTYIIVMTAMEKKRMGIIKKPMILALKSTVPQIVEAFKEAYPLAKVLSPRETDFAAKNRKAMLAQIANNDWDAVVISHENYGYIPHDVDIQTEIIMEEVHNLDVDMDMLRGEKGSVSKQQLKGLEVRKQNLMAKLQELADRPVDKELRTFQQLGVDDLYVDESQQFKNLAYSTKLRGIAGLGSPKGSKRSFNLLYGIRSLQQMHRGDKGTTFLSGTPISNTIVEMYLLLKYLRPTKMEELGMKTFDSWVKNFADNSVDVEFAVTGALKMKDRFRDFINIPELSILYNEIADVRNDRNLKLEKPKYKSGQRILKNVKQSEEQQAYTKKLIKFAETKNGEDLGLGPLSDGQKKAAMLLATNLSAKMAIDMRLIDPYAEDNPSGKLSEAANTIAEHYRESTPHLGTQLIFSDIGTPKTGNTVEDLKDLLQDVYKISDEDLRLAFGEGDKNPPLATVVKRLNEVLEYSNDQINDWIEEAKREAPFNIYDELKKKLIDRGIPADQIAFIHHYKTSRAKAELFKAANDGKIRILLGSTQKLGTGVNAQRRIIALHHVDAPWRPSDMEQRDGRGIRQGNIITKDFYGNQLPVYIYATEGTLDAYKYQLLSIKQGYIDQVKTGAVGQRTFSEGEGDEESGMGYSEYVSILSGNPDILDKAKVDKQVQGLTQSKRNFEQEKFDAQRKIREDQSKISNNKLISDNLKNDVDFINKNVERDDKGDIVYKIKIGDQEFDKPGEAGKEILKKVIENRDNTKKVVGYTTKIGEIAGIDIIGESIEVFKADGGAIKMNYKYYLSAPSGNRFPITLRYDTNETWAGRAPYEALEIPFKRLKMYDDENIKFQGKIDKYNEILQGEWPKTEELNAAMEKQKELQQRLNEAATKVQAVDDVNDAKEEDDIISGLENPEDLDEEIRKAKEDLDRETKGQLNSGIPLNALPQLLRLAFLYAKKGVRTAAEFASRIGARLSKELVNQWNLANKEHKDFVKNGFISPNFKKMLSPLTSGGGKTKKPTTPPRPVWDKEGGQSYLEHVLELSEWQRKYGGKTGADTVREASIAREKVNRALNPKEEAKESILAKTGDRLSHLTEHLDNPNKRITQLEKKVKKLYGGQRNKIPLGRVMEQNHVGFATAAVREFNEKVLTGMDNKDLKNFSEYIFLKRTIDRYETMDKKPDMGSRITGNITMLDAKNVLELIKDEVGPEKMKLFEDRGVIYQEQMDKVPQRIFDAGIIDLDRLNAIKDANNFYAPFNVIQNVFNQETDLKKAAKETTILKKIKGISLKEVDISVKDLDELHDGLFQGLITPDEFYQTSLHILDALVNNGTITQAEYNTQIDSLANPGFAIKDIIDQSAQIIYKSVLLAERNKIMQRVGKLSDEDSQGLLFKKVNGYEKRFDKNGAGFSVPKRPEDIKTEKGNGVMRFMDDGVYKYVEVDRKSADIVNNANPHELNATAKIMNAINSVTRTAVITLSPGFITANAIIDTYRNLAFSKYGAIAGKSFVDRTVNAFLIPVQLTEALFSSFAYNLTKGTMVSKEGKLNNMFKEFMESPGFSGGLYDDIFQGVNNQLKIRTDPNIFKRAWRFIKYFFTLPERIGRSFEQSHKIFSNTRGLDVENIKQIGIGGALKRALGMGIKKNLTAPEMADAIDNISYEVQNYAGSPNFAAVSNLLRYGSVIFQFIAARIKGEMSDYRRLFNLEGQSKKDYARFLLQFGVTTLLPMIILAIKNQTSDDDSKEFDSVNKYLKQNNMMIPSGQKFNYQGEQQEEYFMIPVRGIPQTANNIINAFFTYAKHQDKNIFKEVTAQAIQSTSPVNLGGDDLNENVESVLSSTTSPIKWLVEFGTNRDTYRHKDLISTSGSVNSLYNKYKSGAIKSYEVVSKYPATEQKYVDMSKGLYDMGIMITPIGLKHFEQTFMGGISNTLAGENNPVLKKLFRSETKAPVNFENNKNSAKFTGTKTKDTGLELNLETPKLDLDMK